MGEIDTDADKEMVGAFECFHCLSRSVGWDADFDSEDYGYPEGGIIHALSCKNCGAEIVYYIPGEDENEE